MMNSELAQYAGRLTAERVPFVLATVVRARRPTSVRPGDSAVVLADGTIEGFVGGSCAESSVRLYSLRVLETGEPAAAAARARRRARRNPASRSTEPWSSTTRA